MIHEAGIQVENQSGLLRIPWNRYAGYVEDNSVFLLYYTSGQYRLIPKRALAEREEEIRALVTKHLPLFN